MRPSLSEMVLSVLLLHEYVIFLHAHPFKRISSPLDESGGNNPNEFLAFRIISQISAKDRSDAYTKLVSRPGYYSVSVRIFFHPSASWAFGRRTGSDSETPRRLKARITRFLPVRPLPVPVSVAAGYASLQLLYG